MSDVYRNPYRLCGAPPVAVGALGLLLLLQVAGAEICEAQPAPRELVQAGVAALPGVGLQAGYVGQRSFFTTEAVLYADVSPRLVQDEGSLQVSGAVGGALRPVNIYRVIGNATFAYDLDLGLRFGPSLRFAADATRLDKNQQFRLFLDPFARLSTGLDEGRTFFLEVGTLRPVVRFGLWFRL